MDWGSTLVIAAVVVLVVHILVDGYRTYRNVRLFQHVEYENIDGLPCGRCSYIQDRLDGMRHEAAWTAAAVIVLAGHLILDVVS